MKARKAKSAVRPRTTLDWAPDGDTALWRYLKDYAGRARGRRLKELATLGLAAQNAGLLVDGHGNLMSRSSPTPAASGTAPPPQPAPVDEHRKALNRVVDGLINW